MKTYTLSLVEAMKLLHILRCHWEVRSEDPDEVCMIQDCIYTILGGTFNEYYVKYEATMQQAFTIWLYADAYFEFCKTQNDNEELENAKVLRSKLGGGAGV